MTIFQSQILRWRTSLAALALLAVFLVMPASLRVNAAGTEVTLAEYRQMLAHTRQLLETLPEASQDPQPTLEGLAAEWEAITQVKLEDGRVVQVSHAYLAAQLRSNPPDLKRLERLLAALEDAVASWPGVALPGDALTPLQEILAQPEFQWPEERPSPLTTLWEKFWQAVNRWLNRFDGPLLDANVGSNWLFSGAIVLILVTILAYALRSTLGRLVGEADIAEESEDGGEVLTSSAAIKRAQALSAAGDFRAAVRYLYISSLLLLEERGLLRYNRSLTNREVLRSVANQPSLAAPLKDVVDVFDQVWYGYHSMDEESLKEYAARVNELNKKP